MKNTNNPTEDFMLSSVNHWLDKAKECGGGTVFIPEILEGNRNLSRNECIDRAVSFYEELAFCFREKSSYYSRKARELAATVN